MATTSVDLVVKTRGQQSLERLVNTFKKTETQLEKLKSKLDGKIQRAFKNAASAAENAGKRISNSFRRAAQGAGALTKKLGGLRGAIAGLGINAALGKAFIDASNLESANSRIETLTKNFGQFAGIQAVAARSADKFVISNQRALSDLTDLGNRLGGTGTTLKELEAIYAGFNTLLINNKVNAESAASAQLQLNQALGSGRLAGEEFNAINEATPQLLDQVAKTLRVSRGELKKLASEGKITRAVLIKSLADIAVAGEGDLEKSLSGSFGDLLRFNVALQNFSTVVGQELLPVLTPFIQAATGLLKLFGQLPKPVRTAAVALTAVAGAALLIAPALAAGIAAIKAIGVVAIVAGAKIALIVAAVVGVGVAIAKLAEAWEPFRRALFVVAEFVRGVFVSLSQQFGETTKSFNSNVEAFKKFFVDTWTGLVNFFKGIGKFFVDVWNTVTEFFVTNLGGVAEFFGSVWSGIASFFGGVVQNLKEKWRDFVEFVVNTLSGPLGAVLRAAGINIGEAVANGIANGVGALKGTLPKFQLPKFELPGLDFSGLDFSGDTPNVGSGGGTSGGGGSTKSSAKEIEDQFKKTEEQIAALVRQGIEIGDTFSGIFAVKSTPLQEEISGIEDELLSADKQLEDLLVNFDKLAKGDPRFDGARSQISTLRERLAGFSDEDINKTASERLTQGDREGFEQSLREAQAINQALKEGRTELTATEKLAVKYGDDWANIDQAVRDNLVSLAEGTDKIKAQNDALRQQKEVLDNLYTGIGDTIENGIISAIDAGITSLVEGTKSLDKALQEIASGVLKDIGNQLIKFGINAAFSSLGSGGGLLGKLFGGGRAEGGSVSPDKTFLVGEKGPELFTPTTNGTILPNDFFDSARAALQSPGSAGSGIAEENPEAFAAATAAIQRTNSVITNNRSTEREIAFAQSADKFIGSTSNNINFTTTRVGEMDVVTREEAIEIGRESSKLTEATIYSNLRNRPSLRKQLGM